MIENPAGPALPLLVIGVSGSSSCYKVCNLIRIFRRSVDIHVVMTPAARKFVQPRLFRVLTGNPVLTSLFDQDYPSAHPHVSLAKKASVFLIAPATANSISKVTSGNAIDALSTFALSVSPKTTPCFVAPAMMPTMMEHPAVRANIERLESMGYRVIPPATGVLADGMKGLGRLAEAEDIAEAIRGSLWAEPAARSVERSELGLENQEALDLFRSALHMYNLAQLAPANRVGNLGPDDYLYGRKGQVSSRVLREVLGNIEELAKERHKTLSFFDSKGLFNVELDRLETVATFVVYLTSRLADGQVPG